MLNMETKKETQLNLIYQLLIHIQEGLGIVNIEKKFHKLSKFISNDVKLYFYCLNNSSEDIYLYNQSQNIISKVYDFPTFESLKSSDFSDKYKSDKEKNEQIQKSKNFYSLVAGIISSIAMIITIFMFVYGVSPQINNFFSKSDLLDKIAINSEQNQFNQERLILISTNLENFKKSVKSLSSIPDGHGCKTEAAQVRQEIISLGNRLSALENALTLNPEKALAVPILRKDLENIEQTLHSELIQAKAEINRVYEQNKWFIGIMFTVALSVLAMAVSSFNNRKDT